MDIKGQIVMDEYFVQQSPGTQSYLWNAKKQSSGVYLCNLIVNGNILSSKKITLLK